jgi:hypothetical protein
VVLVETMRQLGLPAVTVSQRGLADGVLARWDEPSDAMAGTRVPTAGTEH